MIHKATLSLHINDWRVFVDTIWSRNDKLGISILKAAVFKYICPFIHNFRTDPPLSYNRYRPSQQGPLHISHYIGAPMPGVKYT